MAKIETTFIRPKELYTPETGETKVVYDGYQNNPHELVVEENLEGEVSEIVNDTFVPNEGGNVVFTDNNETEHELITEDGFAGALDDALPSALAKAQVIETTWQELKDKRDNGELNPGSLYRITDYNCTTTQENTHSAGHQFDIVLLALSANKLAEEGWAMMNESNIYDVTFADGVTKKCWIYQDDIYDNIVDCSTLIGTGAMSIGEEDDNDVILNKTNRTAICTSVSSSLHHPDLTYNYFQNTNLSAWKVWYCLDNDTDRFAWADDSVDDKAKISWIEIDESFISTRDTEADTTLNGTNYFAWYDEHYGGDLYTTNEIPSVGDKIYEIAQNMGGQSVASEFSTVDSYSNATNLPNGRGVIYRLIDEWNNDVCYDFKNIQILDNDAVWYLFSGLDEDNNTYFDTSLCQLESFQIPPANNKISNMIYLQSLIPTGYFLTTPSSGIYECPQDNIITGTMFTVENSFTEFNQSRVLVGYQIYE